MQEEEKNGVSGIDVAVGAAINVAEIDVDIRVIEGEDVKERGEIFLERGEEGETGRERGEPTITGGEGFRMRRA